MNLNCKICIQKTRSSKHSCMQEHIHTKPFHPKLHPTNDLFSRYAPIKIPKIDVLRSDPGRSCPRFKNGFSPRARKVLAPKTINSHTDCFVCAHLRLLFKQMICRRCISMALLHNACGALGTRYALRVHYDYRVQSLTSVAEFVSLKSSKRPQF